MRTKKTEPPFKRQLGYLSRPVAFRPYLMTGLALSHIK